jgi:hypothetical protein
VKRRRKYGPVKKDADGFFWSEAFGHRYCVVVLHRTRYEWKDNAQGERVRRPIIREYQANTVRELRQKARRWQLPRRVAALCLSSVKYT